MKLYELAVILHPDMDESARDKLIGMIEKIIKQFEGEINKSEADGKKTLAYPIKKQAEGWFYYLHIGLPAEAVDKLTTKVKMEDQILRHMILAK